MQLCGGTRHRRGFIMSRLRVWPNRAWNGHIQSWSVAVHVAWDSWYEIAAFKDRGRAFDFANFHYRVTRGCD